jgi:hypothetical protein
MDATPTLSIATYITDDFDNECKDNYRAVTHLFSDNEDMDDNESNSNSNTKSKNSSNDQVDKDKTATGKYSKIYMDKAK